jgi:hypothetical protein
MSDFLLYAALSAAFLLHAAAFGLIFATGFASMRGLDKAQARNTKLASELRQVQDELSVLQLRLDDLTAYRATPLSKLSKFPPAANDFAAATVNNSPPQT